MNIIFVAVIINMSLANTCTYTILITFLLCEAFTYILITLADTQLCQPAHDSSDFHMTSHYLERSAVLEAMGQQVYLDETQASALME